MATRKIFWISISRRFSMHHLKNVGTVFASSSFQAFVLTIVTRLMYRTHVLCKQQFCVAAKKHLRYEDNVQQSNKDETVEPYDIRKSVPEELLFRIFANFCKYLRFSMKQYTLPLMAMILSLYRNSSLVLTRKTDVFSRSKQIRFYVFASND